MMTNKLLYPDPNLGWELLLVH